MQRQAYPTDLTDAQWELMAPFFPEPPTQGRTGRPREYAYREIVNGILYVLRTSCQWDLMPHDLPPQATCYHYFRKWQKDGTWNKIHDALRERLREQMGREATPSAAVLDSQSVKTTQKGGLPIRTLLAMMQASVSKDASAIFWSIPKACSLKS